MNSVFRVELSGREGRCGELSLPAAAYQLLDALERLGAAPEEPPCWEILEYRDFEYLDPFLRDSGSLYELNALAKRLGELDERQSAAFEGLVGMEIRKRNGPILLPRLIDLASSTDCCHVVDTALNDSQLGRFYAENGFVEELEGLPDGVFELLDFERIGRERRLAEGGVFTPQGYVVQHEELREVCKALDLTPREPGYTLLLELSKGFFNDPAYDNDRTARLALPARLEAVESALEAVDAASWKEAAFHCVDCAVPQAMDWLDFDGDFLDVMSFACSLDDLRKEGELPKYKAVLTAAECGSLEDAMQLADRLEEYSVDSDIHTPEETAEDEVNFLVPKEDAALLKKHLNLFQYGNELLEHNHAVLTPYGLIQHETFRPIQDVQAKPSRDEMELR